MATEPVILGDWGSTRLRLWLRCGGATVASHEAPGLLVAREDPAQALRSALSRFDARAKRRRIVLCGMAGTRDGLAEAGYVPCPGGVEEWVGASLSTSLDEFPITILPGFACRDREARPDVMRGEETQVFGALALHGEKAGHPRTIVLPGTHSKWVSVKGDRIALFATCPTGEIHARLAGSSLAPEANNDPGTDDSEGFLLGIERARTGGALIASLFEARAARMLDAWTGTRARSFLSGLLIGSEIAAMAQRLEPRVLPLLVGSPDLVRLYRTAFERFGLACRTADGESCTLRGLEIADAKLG